MKKVVGAIYIAIFLFLGSYYGGRLLAENKITSQNNKSISSKVSTENDDSISRQQDNNNESQSSEVTNTTNASTQNQSTSTQSTNESTQSFDNSNSTNIESGKEITLSADAPVCSSADNVDKMINYVKNKNEQAIENMESRGESKVIPKGSKVTVVKTGIVDEIEDKNGEHWYAPHEILK
ncbi:hypothetical protein [Clostridium sp. JS66]|uniref:hypothetical protein n=1 Tax=Clostridium sp. JS66 TaxID=3064705 RepID=UPI00298E267A|nr:hypothetical protein [Clostridium sp. JS66]WPC42983.1 hypothetical protein Q6H37_05785 [Clostridium sp. JS66]